MSQRQPHFTSTSTGSYPNNLTPQTSLSLDYLELIFGFPPRIRKGAVSTLLSQSTERQKNQLSDIDSQLGNDQDQPLLQDLGLLQKTQLDNLLLALDPSHATSPVEIERAYAKCQQLSEFDGITFLEMFHNKMSYTTLDRALVLCHIVKAQKQPGTTNPYLQEQIVNIMDDLSKLCVDENKSLRGLAYHYLGYIAFLNNISKYNGTTIEQFYRSSMQEGSLLGSANLGWYLFTQRANLNGLEYIFNALYNNLPLWDSYYEELLLAVLHKGLDIKAFMFSYILSLEDKEKKIDALINALYQQSPPHSLAVLFNDDDTIKQRMLEVLCELCPANDSRIQDIKTQQTVQKIDQNTLAETQLPASANPVITNSNNPSLTRTKGKEKEKENAEDLDLMKRRQLVLGNIIKNATKSWEVKMQELHDLLQSRSPHYALFQGKSVQDSVRAYQQNLRKKKFDEIQNIPALQERKAALQDALNPTHSVGQWFKDTDDAKTLLENFQQLAKHEKLEAQKTAQRSLEEKYIAETTEALDEIQDLMVDPLKRLKAFQAVLAHRHLESNHLFKNIEFDVQSTDRISMQVCGMLRARIIKTVYQISDPMQQVQEMCCIISNKNNSQNSTYGQLFIGAPTSWSLSNFFSRSTPSTPCAAEVEKVERDLQKDVITLINATQEPKEKVQAVLMAYEICSNNNNIDKMLSPFLPPLTEPLCKTISDDLLSLSPRAPAHPPVQAQANQDENEKKLQVYASFFAFNPAVEMQPIERKIAALKQATDPQQMLGRLFQHSNQLPLLQEELMRLEKLQAEANKKTLKLPSKPSLQRYDAHNKL